jgi:glycosyltransferase involved in cell wall biosynthesis
MKKILFIVTKSENGGAQKWVKEQIEILKEYYEVYIVTDEEGWLIQNTFVQGYLTDSDIKKKFSPIFLFKFVKFLKDNKIDLIVASSANAGIYSRLSKIFYKTKVVYVGHGWSSIYNGGKLKWFYTSIEYFLAYFTESILCVSTSDYNRARDEIGISESRLKLIKNKILPMKRKKSFNQKGDIKVMSVARFRLPKRNDLLIKAMENINAELYLIGDGPLRKELEKQKNDKVHFLGEIDSFDKFYKYDIFVLISDSEGLPLSAIEAMSAGLPLVLSDVGGCPELISGNGVLVQNMEQSICKGIKIAIDNREEYSKNSIDFFNEAFNLVTDKNIYIEYYASFLGE